MKVLLFFIFISILLNFIGISFLVAGIDLLYGKEKIVTKTDKLANPAFTILLLFLFVIYWCLVAFLFLYGGQIVGTS